MKENAVSQGPFLYFGSILYSRSVNARRDTLYSKRQYQQVTIDLDIINNSHLIVLM